VSIGFDLYCSLLRQAIERLKGGKVKARIEVVVRTDFVATREADFFKSEIGNRKSEIGLAPAFLPQSYIAESKPRIQAYRRLNEVATPQELDALRKTWRDRFGKLPPAAENLLTLTEIKLAAAACKIAVVEAREGKLMLTRSNDFILIDGKFPRLSASDPAARLREMLAMLRAL
jgi:transcription-repair coupling factor (superfamily II helicase)